MLVVTWFWCVSSLISGTSLPVALAGLALKKPKKKTITSSLGGSLVVYLVIVRLKPTIRFSVKKTEYCFAFHFSFKINSK